MKVLRGLLILVLVLLSGGFLFAQRTHEIQLQIGRFRNNSVTFYDYYETPEIRHNFEFDQTYSSQFLTLSWNYPINGYVETGIFVTQSLNAKLNLEEAESGVFNTVSGTSLRPDTLFLGSANLKSNFTEIGVNLRLNLVRLNKLKTYLILTPSLITMNNINHKDNLIKAKDENLKQELLNRYLISETKILLGLGLGFSYPLGNGINLKILEIYAKNIPGNSTIIGSLTSLELKTGISYQFYRRK